MNTVLICLIVAGFAAGALIALTVFFLGAYWDASREAKDAEELEALTGEVWHER